jgi:hypothetical protein
MDLKELKTTKFFIEKGTLILKNKNVERKDAVKKLSKRLAAASEKELNDYTISSSGYGIHWNKIDEDISVAALLKEPKVVYRKRNAIK